MDAETPHWFALTFQSGLATADVHHLIRSWCVEKKHSLAELFELDPSSWESAGLSDQQQEALARAKAALPDALRELEPCGIARIAVLDALHPLYPKTVAATMGRIRPPLLFCAGNPELLLRPVVSIIGARKAGQPGFEFTRDIATFLARQGVAVATAYADGVNRCALLAALGAGGSGILFLAQGSLTPGYTGENLGAYMDRGRLAVVSACGPREQRTPAHLAQCDALVSALSDETILGEAGKSGDAWEAARTALRQRKRLWVRRDDNPALGHSALVEMGARPAPWPNEEYEAWRMALTQRALEPRRSTAEGVQLTETAAGAAGEIVLFPDFEEGMRRNKKDRTAKEVNFDPKETPR